MIDIAQYADLKRPKIRPTYKWREAPWNRYQDNDEPYGKPNGYSLKFVLVR